MSNQKPTVLITGAYGFVGQALSRYLIEQGYRVVGWVRSLQPVNSIEGVDYHSIGDLDFLSISQLQGHIQISGAQKIVHLAARVHQMHENSEGKRERYFKTNRDFSVQLHQAAQRENIDTFIFMSTVKVMGENSEIEINEASPPTPKDDYADSKLAAEQDILNQTQSSIKTYVFRVPLIFGQAAKGNFRFLLQAVSLGLPLPLGSIHNRRSMLYIENLCSALERAISHARPPSGVYFVTDDATWSTPQLILMMASALGKKIWLVPFPPKFLHFFASLLGKGNYTSRLTASFFFSGNKFRQDFHWSPPFSPAESLKRTLEGS
jgi:nucleoside-diphosphate-sugar epimerase